MTLSQTNPDARPRPEPFRWSRSQATQTCHDFHDPQRPPTSQRQFAQQTGVPRSTLQYWEQQRLHPELEPEVAAFCECPAGLRFLRGLVTALHLVFHQAGHVGLRPLTSFLRLTQLDHFVAASYGSQQAFAVQMRDELIAYGEAERARLAAGMTPQDITLCADENFHGDQACLVAMEPVSNFLVLEEYHEHRDGVTWTTAIQQAVAGLPVTVSQLTSDQARGLLACARDGLPAQHSPDLFHYQRELTQRFRALFQRSSSCVEGRNGRLSLCHHGQGALSGPRLQALTVVHNYLGERADGTTAAERFFGSKPNDRFTWLLERLPELPRPARGASRARKQAAEAGSIRPNP